MFKQVSHSLHAFAPLEPLYSRVLCRAYSGITLLAPPCRTRSLRLLMSSQPIENTFFSDTAGMWESVRRNLLRSVLGRSAANGPSVDSL